MQEQIQNLIGLINGGELDKAIARAKRLAKSAPAHPVIPNIIGAAYSQQNKHGPAAEWFARAVRIDPRMFPAHNNLGSAYLELGRNEDAIGCFTRALRLKPDYAQAHHNLGNAFSNLGRHDEAAASYRRALGIEPGMDQARQHLAGALNQLGAHDEAAELYAGLLARGPGEAALCNGLGLARAGQGRVRDAAECYRRAIALDPDFAEALNNLGNALAELDDLDGAIDAYQRAIALNPRDPSRHWNLFTLYEKTSRLDALASGVAKAAEQLRPGDPSLGYWKGVVAARDDRFADAIDEFERVAGADLPLLARVRMADFRGRSHDRLDQAAKAWAAYQQMNRLACELQTADRFSPGAYLAEIDALTEAWKAAPSPARADAPPPAAWADTPPFAASADAPPPGPRRAFLVGFPRSGTTLLDTILRSHPLVRVVEEQPLIARVRDHLGRAPTPECLAALGEAELDALRAVYTAALDAHLGPAPEGVLTIDKLPLNIVNAGVINRLFPRAPILLALRHPCDCVLSCLMQNFQLNDAMMHFTGLESTARLYASAMALWEAYDAALPLCTHQIRYEDLVGDFQGTLDSLLHALDLPWDDALLRYRETALARGRIHTPSYSQVTRALYAHASGRWVRYRDQMAPVLPLLQPWARRWGYEIDGA
ncbi:MAG: tetratricopeptide repeat protein [Pseudomonadota bacterium]